MAQYAQVFSRALVGVDAPEILTEVQLANGLPSVAMVGLPEASVRESRDRVKSALSAIDFKIPPKKITINLAPADFPKQGGRYDLPIALGIVLATGFIQPNIAVENIEWLGELGLNGEIRPVSGVLPSVLAAKAAGRMIVVPEENLAEALLVEGAQVLGANHLLDVVHFISGNADNLKQSVETAFSFSDYEQDIADIKGQAQAKRVLELCASGGHSLMMMGPPGSGKSMLANRLITILPELSIQQAIEIASVESVSGKRLDVEKFYQRRLVQSHHTSTVAAMVGGGSGHQVKPGAVSLAHHGVLFLDELPEFGRSVLEALREPLESKFVEISRANQHVTFPAKVQLIIALNPSPSGYFPDDPLNRCTDTPEQILNYRRKLSGPLLDRIDCHLEVPPVDYQSLSPQVDQSAETSETVRARVIQAQQLQYQRQGCLNSDLSVGQLNAMLQEMPLDEMSDRLLQQAVEKRGLSARAYHRVIRVARTLADMVGSESITAPQIAEAVSYRSFDSGSR